jgi:hypothetical protein
LTQKADLGLRESGAYCILLHRFAFDRHHPQLPALPPLAEQLGRKRTLAIYFLGTMVCIVLSFGWALYLGDALRPFITLLFFLGFSGGKLRNICTTTPLSAPLRSVTRSIGASLERE